MPGTKTLALGARSRPEESLLQPRARAGPPSPVSNTAVAPSGEPAAPSDCASTELGLGAAAQLTRSELEEPPAPQAATAGAHAAVRGDAAATRLPTRTGLPPDRLTAHSRRIGGASALYNATGEIETVKRYGRGTSGAFHRYLWDSAEQAKGVAAKCPKGMPLFTGYPDESPPAAVFASRCDTD